MGEFKTGDYVKENKYGYKGVIKNVFEGWKDLKKRQEFLTIDPDNESNNMDDTEKMIIEDPRDKWLAVQKIPFTEEQLNENWYSIELDYGGAIWTCESLLEKVKQN